MKNQNATKVKFFDRILDKKYEIEYNILLFKNKYIWENIQWQTLKITQKKWFQK